MNLPNETTSCIRYKNNTSRRMYCASLNIRFTIITVIIIGGTERKSANIIYGFWYLLDISYFRRIRVYMFIDTDVIVWFMRKIIYILQTRGIFTVIRCFSWSKKIYFLSVDEKIYFPLTRKDNFSCNKKNNPWPVKRFIFLL